MTPARDGSRIADPEMKGALDHGNHLSAFPPIGEYAFLSDCETTALIAPNGNVEWLCLPRMDSPSVFGAILDRDAGSFRVAPADVNVPAARRYIPGTSMFNMSGQPAMSVPLAWNKAGLPLGMMFSARFGDEATLFRLAGQLEQVRPWKNRIPPVCA